jgi:threonine synthase
MTTLPRLDTVQTAGGWPLRRAYERVTADLRAVGLDPDAGLDDARPEVHEVLDHAARHRSAYMWPWETEPRSIAHGILDDETYDWLAVVRAMLASGGRPLVVDEPALGEANELAVRTTGIDADATGSAGLAGVLGLRRLGSIGPDERVGVLVTGRRRTPPAARPNPAASHPERSRR